MWPVWRWLTSDITFSTMKKIQLVPRLCVGSVVQWHFPDGFFFQLCQNSSDCLLLSNKISIVPEIVSIRAKNPTQGNEQVLGSLLKNGQ